MTPMHQQIGSSGRRCLDILGLVYDEVTGWDVGMLEDTKNPGSGRELTGRDREGEI